MSSPLSITLTEPAVFVRRGNDAPLAVVRAILTLSLPQSTRIRRIEVALEGKSKLEWSGTPKRPAVHETREILSAKTVLFSADVPKTATGTNSASLRPLTSPSTSSLGSFLKRPRSAVPEVIPVPSSTDGRTAEFKAGVYNYPIAFTLPNDCPPSVQSEHGSIKYRLKATVHRPGALSRAWTDSAKVQVVPRPAADIEQMGFECEGMALAVERRWSDSLIYQVSLPTTLCPVETILPLSLSLLPIAGVKLFRLGIRIDENIVYDSKSGSDGLNEVHKHEIICLRQSPILEVPLLPLPYNVDPLRSPLAPYLDEPDDHKGCPLQSSSGPWGFRIPIQLPIGLHVSNKQPGGNICITHKLVLTMTLQSEKRPEARLFDVHIDMGLTILSAHFRKARMFLPAYCASGDAQEDAATDCARGLKLFRGRTEQFVRLSSGRENPEGELSPPYTYNSDILLAAQPDSCPLKG